MLRQKLLFLRLKLKHKGQYIDFVEQNKMVEQIIDLEKHSNYYDWEL